MNVSFLISSLALVSASSAFAVHDDDPKILDREAPYVGPAYRRAQLGAPGGLSGVPTGSQALAGGGFDSNGVSLLSWLPLGEFGSPQSGADCWGYTSPSGREYGLMGHYDGMTVIEVTNPFDAQVVDTIPSTSSLWHDVKVYQDKAYVCNEGGGGVQVVDLSNVDNGVVSVVGNITSGGSTTTHNVFINEDSGYLYRTGGSDNGLRIYDLNASLTNPPLVASWSTRYVHDAQIVTYFSGPYAGKEIAFCNSGFNGGSVQTGLDILDVTNKNSIQVLANVDYDNAGYSHQGWLSPDRQYFYLNDEFDENGSLPTTTYVMDVSNLSNPFQASKFDNGNQAVGHNLYMKDNLIYEANYRSGLRVFDATDALNPTEVAFFDTYPGSDSNSYNGLWSIYPFFESGTIIGSDLERGFFVWIMGEVPLTLNLPQGAPNLVDPAGESLAVTVTEDTPGNYASGTGMLHVEVGGVWTSYPMIDQGGGNLTANFPSLPCGTSFNYYVSADSTTGGTWAEPSLAPAELFSAVSGVGITTLISDEMTSVGTWNSGVPTDDATTGMWELVNPNGTAAQPEDDHTPSGTTCWVTGQGSAGGSLGDNDVDDGMNTLVSPTYDLSSAAQPQISYWRWYSNNQNSSIDDTFVVEVTDGSGWVEVESVGPGNPESSGGWYQHTFAVSDFVTPTATVRVRFRASDYGDGSIVEAAIDDLTISDVDCDACGGGVTASNYCVGANNSTGFAAAIGSTGSTSLASNDLVLNVTGSVPTSMGLFYYGGAQVQAVFGDGFRCVGAGSTGIFRLPPPSPSGILGDVTRPIDYTASPMASGGGMVSAGDTRYFQYWYRDVPAGGSGFNLSDGLSVTFCP